MKDAPARKAGDAFGIAQSKTLIDLRIDPEFGALPQFGADEIHDVPALAALVWIEAVRPEIGRVKRRIVLLDESGLAVQREAVELERGNSLGEDIGIDAVVAELVVEADAHGLQRQIGIEALRAGGKGDAARRVIGVEIFEPRRPIRRQTDFDAGADHAAESRHHEKVFDGARRRGAARGSAGDLRAA